MSWDTSKSSEEKWSFLIWILWFIYLFIYIFFYFYFFVFYVVPLYIYSFVSLIGVVWYFSYFHFWILLMEVLVWFVADSVQNNCNIIFNDDTFYWDYSPVRFKPFICWSCKSSVGMGCSIILHLVCWYCYGWDLFVFPC